MFVFGLALCVCVLSYNDYWFSLFRLAMLLEIGHMWRAIVCVFGLMSFLWVDKFVVMMIFWHEVKVVYI